MTSEKGYKKDKNQNIQVFVRLRPLNQRERDIKSLGVIEVLHNREVVVRQSHTKRFTFDRAFPPNAKQVEVYQEVVSPLIEEVLAGYNCTVFAYGQTGTGKTHTMVGENSGDETAWQTDPLAGIIPRALSQLFDELRISNTEYTVRVSYLELYNEELFDLLSSSEDNSKLRIYEDVTRKGSNIVNGLEEITVYNKNEVYRIMEQGQERKRVASTLMNAQSSRSHTVFTIVVHMKENSPEGEELVKIGKLNLVDLAGSENINKAGSDNPAKRERARECVNINQSLLTLGRVITALVERHPHIPYRESKLTRILQESLGGRTKTSIIATISPGHKDLEETMSTLEYAHRAKNIQNKPEVNQKLTKKAILKEYAEEIDRLKRDLQAARDKNGVYLANETFTELTLKQEEQRKEIQELLLKKRAMEEEKDKMENVFSGLNKTLEKRISELNATKNKLNNTKSQLANTSNMLVSTKLQVEEQAHIVQRQQATEAALTTQARQLLDVADVATAHAHCLHDTLDKRRTVESTNIQATTSYQQQSSQHRATLAAVAQQFTQDHVEQLNSLHTALDKFASTSNQTLQENKTDLEELVQKIVQSMNELKSLSSESLSKLIEATEFHRSQVKAAVDGHRGGVQAAFAALLHSVAGCVQAARDQDVGGTVGKFVEQWYCGASSRVTSLQQLHAAFARRACDTEQRRGDAARQARDSQRTAAERRADNISAQIAKIEEDKSQLNELVSRHLSEMEAERRDAESRLQQWAQREVQEVEEEIRRLGEKRRRIEERVESEKAALDQRLSKKASDLATDRGLLEARIASHMEWLRAEQDHAEELQQAEQVLRESEGGREESLASLRSYGNEFDQGTVAISTDMEVFSRNVVEVVQHIYNDFLNMLITSKDQIETDTRAASETDAATTEQFAADSDAALAQLVSNSKDVLDTVLSRIESNNNTSITTLNSLSAAADALAASTEAQCGAHGSTVGELAAGLASFQQQLDEAVAGHEELEGRWLREEYKLYSPTGKTPSRAEFRYPRALAVTSPHERILARFRALHRRHNDSECIVVEDTDPESPQASDCESSLSEDSATFLTPPDALGPPAPPAPLVNGNRNLGIVKCTSESDIYTIKRQEDECKENADRSMTYKKPSKLPAPQSKKKPLLERNDN